MQVTANTDEQIFKVMIVDDDPHVRQHIDDVLHYVGYQTVHARDGENALLLAGQEMPDLILTDVNMPGLDGYGLLGALRGDPQTNTIPIVFVTAENDYPAMRRAMAYGADDFLTKPFSPAELLKVIDTQLKKMSAIEEKHDTTITALRKNIMYALPHELRTPLQLIHGHAELLNLSLDSVRAEDVADSAQAIIRAAERLQRLIENYLIYAQLELIAKDSEEQDALRNHLVKDAGAIIADAASEAAENYGRLSDLDLTICTYALRISKHDLHKVVMELVDNAFKFSARGSTVHVHATVHEDGLRLEIEDHGRGMSADQVQSVGAYMQFDRDLYEQQGLGLGLSVAQRLVQLHEGHFEIYSELGTGTTIAIFLHNN